MDAIISQLGGNFIIAGSEKWDCSSKTCKHHLVREFARRGARVLYVENISMRRIGSMGSMDYRKVVDELGRFFRGVSSPMDNVFCLNPLYLPFPHSKAARQFNTLILSSLIKFHARRLGIRHPVFMYFMPTGLMLQGRLHERLSAYYITDNYTAFADLEHDVVGRLERKALQTADVVFATAKTLAEDRSHLRPDIHFSPHGVEAEHFAAAQTDATRVPDEVATIPRPRIGFMGGLGPDYVDLDLFIDLARRRRDWNFVLIGRQFSDISHLLAEPNIRFLGPKLYEDLPGYLKGFDVALIPFLTNNLTRDVNPIKLREYLAAGLPVVGTDLPPIRVYDKHVRLATDRDGYERAIADALANPGNPAERQAAVAGESWSSRAEAVLKVLAESHAIKYKGGGFC